MTDTEYLTAVVADQTFPPDAPEVAALTAHRDAVQTLLEDEFGSGCVTIRYGGSKAKGTMIRASYDLDITAYFGAESTEAGSSLRAIYENVEAVLRQDYWTETKPSAIRLRDRDADDLHADFHIDVVPGRFFDATETDVWIYQNVPDHERLKTNLDVHRDHVKNSGVRSALKLLKLWRVQEHVGVRNFVLELLAIDLLQSRKGSALPSQLTHVLETLRDSSSQLTVQDPANPGGNDLSSLLDASVKSTLAATARRTLDVVSRRGWEGVFGPVGQDERKAALQRVSASVPAAAQVAPWIRD